MSNVLGAIDSLNMQRSIIAGIIFFNMIAAGWMGIMVQENLNCARRSNLHFQKPSLNLR